VKRSAARIEARMPSVIEEGFVVMIGFNRFRVSPWGVPPLDPE